VPIVGLVISVSALTAVGVIKRLRPNAGALTDVVEMTLLGETSTTHWTVGVPTAVAAEMALGVTVTTRWAVGELTDVADVTALGVTVTTRWIVGEPTAVAPTMSSTETGTPPTLTTAGLLTEDPAETTSFGVISRRRSTAGAVTDVATETASGYTSICTKGSQTKAASSTHWKVASSSNLKAVTPVAVGEDTEVALVTLLGLTSIRPVTPIVGPSAVGVETTSLGVIRRVRPMDGDATEVPETTLSG